MNCSLPEAVTKDLLTPRQAMMKEPFGQSPTDNDERQ